MSNTATTTSTSTTTITDPTTAEALVTMVKNQMKQDKIRYSAYVRENGVTVDNVADHVKALREMAFPGIKADGRAEFGTPERDAKRFADKVRLGLRTHIGDAPEDRKADETDWIARLTNDASKALQAGHSADDVMSAVKAVLRDAQTPKAAKTATAGTADKITLP